MISGTLSQDDYLAAQRLHRHAFVRRQLWILLAFVLIGLAIVWAGHWLIGAIVFGAGAGGLISEFLLSTFLMPRRHLRIFRQQASLRSEFRYAWDAEGISVVTDAANAQRPWRHYVKRKESEAVFLLYHTDEMFEVLPKAWFRSEAQVDEFRRLASRVGDTGR